MEKISVIVPIYNVEKYLRDCIESIICQTYTNLEIILVNDGSTDNCENICNEYVKKDSRIKLINKGNGGLSSARNAGIDVANGDYLVFIDSDDYVNKSMIEVLRNLLINNNADIAQCEFEKFYDSKNISDNSTFKETITVKNNKEALLSLSKIDGKGVNAVVAWNKIYKKKLFDDIRYPINKIHEDQFTTYKLIYKANKIVYTNKKLYYYRQRENSIMNSKFDKKRLVVLDAIEEKINFFKGMEKYESVYYESIHQYINNAIGNYKKYKESNPNDCITLKNIKKRLNKIYFIAIKSSNISLKIKIKLTLFIINPRGAILLVYR